MIDLSTRPKQPNHWVRLNQEFQSDLLWWHYFIEGWNGRSMLVTHYTVSWEVEFYTDAPGSWCCGGIWNNSWFSCAWNNEWSGVGIAAKELLPVVLAVGIWGKLWQYKHVCVHTDNMAVVEVMKAKDSKVPLMMHLLRCLHFLCARWDIVILAKHVKGSLNTAADVLSRNSLQVLRSVAPSAHVNPTPTKWEDTPNSNPTLAVTGVRETRLAVAQLETQANRFLLHGIAESTTKLDRHAQNTFLSFYQRLQLDPLPASEDTLILFAAELAQSISHSSIRSYLSGVRHLHIIHGLTNPLEKTLRLDLVLRGIRRDAPKKKYTRLPITPLILRCIKAKYSIEP